MPHQTLQVALHTGVGGEHWSTLTFFRFSTDARVFKAWVQRVKVGLWVSGHQLHQVKQRKCVGRWQVPKLLTPSKPALWTVKGSPKHPFSPPIFVVGVGVAHCVNKGDVA